MNNKLLIAGLAVLAIAGGAIGGYAVIKLSSNQLLGGDFAGGITPSQLFTASTATNSVSPIMSNLYVSGAVSAGGVAANNQITALYTATEAYPATAFNLGAITNATSATSTSFSFNASGFSVGDACEVSYNGATTTSAFGADAFVTAVNGNSVTGTATFWNGASTAIGFTVTSTATGASSTLKLTCFHTGV